MTPRLKSKAFILAGLRTVVEGRSREGRGFLGSGPSLLTFIQPSAWNRRSANFAFLEFSEIRGSKRPIGRGGKHSTTARCTGPPASSLRQTPPTFLRAPTSWAARKARGIAGSGGSVQVPGRLPRPFLSDAPIHPSAWKRLSREFATHACNTSKSSGPPCLLEWWPC